MTLSNILVGNGKKELCLGVLLHSSPDHSIGKEVAIKVMFRIIVEGSNDHSWASGITFQHAGPQKRL